MMGRDLRVIVSILSLKWPSQQQLKDRQSCVSLLVSLLAHVYVCVCGHKFTHGWALHCLHNLQTKLGAKRLARSIQWDLDSVELEVFIGQTWSWQGKQQTEMICVQIVITERNAKAVDGLGVTQLRMGFPIQGVATTSVQMCMQEENGLDQACHTLNWFWTWSIAL